MVNNQEMLWRMVSVASAVTGLICYALSSSFNHLLGNWKPWKIIFYTLFSSITFLVAVLAKDWRKSSTLRFIARKWQRFRILRFRSLTTFLVMLSTTVFSFFSDRAKPVVKPDAYSVVSSVAFSTMSLSLSRSVPFVFEELMYFSMGIFIAQMMKIKLLLGFFVGILVSFCFVILHSLVDAHDPTELLGIQDQHPEVAIDIALLQGHGKNDAMTNTAAAPPSTVQQLPASNEDEGSPGPLNIMATENGVIDRLKRWRQAALVLIASCRFRYMVDYLKKEEEREQEMRRIRNHAEAIREAGQESETVQPFLTSSDDDDDEEEEEEKEEAQEEEEAAAAEEIPFRSCVAGEDYCTRIL
ncbi:hypothetical protein S83_000624 [Arachis hypogaea]|nr:Calcium-transporting ATPase 10, plasma membrane-type [Arachis hypogaea]